jgi:DNA invertase Pin-like site-specific DNA recombinase
LIDCVRIIEVQDAFDSAAGTSDMQAGLSGIMSLEFRRMIRARTHAALESRAEQKRATGGRAYGYRDGKVDKGAAHIVREIFGKFADGASCRTIDATALLRARVPFLIDG